MNEDLANEIDEEKLLKQLQRETKTSRFMQTHYEGLNDPSAIHTREIDSCQLSRRQEVPNHDDGINNDEVIHNVLSADVSKVSKASMRPTSLKKGQSYKHVGNGGANSSVQNQHDH